jgi:2,4-dienoyl-CoA reductase-like NADH-dependent reductase (Old Yellow Enzyme family)
MTATLFSTVTFGGTTFANRIVVSPMCQYSAVDGSASPWHWQHLGQYAVSGAALVMVEATAVEATGRITPRCLGLYTDENERALVGVIEMCKAVGGARFGIQLAHSGRKGSCRVPWDGGGAPLSSDEGAWTPVGPSAIRFSPERPVPAELDRAGMTRIRDAFAQAAQRAARIGFDAVELHAAHGYLLHSFLSPISNRRTDSYGGPLANRMRFPLEVAAALREAWPSGRTLGVRLNMCDFVDGGNTLDDTLTVVQSLKAIGFDYACISYGGIFGGQRIDASPGFLLPSAARVRARTGIGTLAVGMIVDPRLAESAVASGQVDMVALARAFLDDPRWVWHAAEALGVELKYPGQYDPVHPKRWTRTKMLADTHDTGPPLKQSNHVKVAP